MESAVGNEHWFEVVYPNGVMLRARKDVALAELRALVQLFD